MFNLSGSEVVFLLLAGLVVLGPERLPGVIRRVGKTYGQLRRMASSFEAEMKETFGEPLEEIRGAVKGLSDEVNKATASGKWFGEVDNEPSPPMRPERSAAPSALENTGQEIPTDETPTHEPQETDRTGEA
ncbi:MAG: hypothetical protein FJW98_02355 [Actinobacteria bacterium]|nr:hypothetical protein [Actinomycetota bacterium]